MPKLRVRPFAKLWHRWFGLIGGFWLLLLAVTGCLITFYDELDTVLNPDLRTVPVAAATAPIETVMQRARSALPGFVATQIDLPNQPGQSLWLIGRAPGSDGALRPAQLFADPADGRILGWRESGAVTLDRRHLMDMVYGLHVDLLVAPWVTWLFGLLALAWVFDHGVAAALSFPRLARWRAAFTVSGRTGSLRRLFDLHRAPGLWAFPVTLVLAVTGLTLAWPEDSRSLARKLSPVSERLHETWPEVGAPEAPIGVDTAMSIVAQRDQIDSVRPLSDHAVYAVRTFDPRDPDAQGRLWTYVSMRDGRIVASRHDNGASAGDLFFAWQYPLHSGQAFGLPGRLLIFAGGIVTIFLCSSGFLLWTKRGAPRFRRSRPL